VSRDFKPYIFQYTEDIDNFSSTTLSNICFIINYWPNNRVINLRNKGLQLFKLIFVIRQLLKKIDVNYIALQLWTIHKESIYLLILVVVIAVNASFD
jgi:hypothetical protein